MVNVNLYSSLLDTLYSKEEDCMSDWEYGLDSGNFEEYEIVDVCDHCGDAIYKDGEFYSDSDGNAFCCEDCAIWYHGIEEVDN